MAFEVFPDNPGDSAPNGDSRSQPRVELLVRSGCHLCDDARRVVQRVVAEVGAGLVERDIDADADDVRRYSEQVPVLFVDGVQVDFWRISESRLRAALIGR
jgi:hypothetical protein